MWKKLKWIKALIMPLPIVFTFGSLVAAPRLVEGSSMQPTINPNGGREIILVERYVRYEQFKRGDIVVLKSPVDPGKLVIKRIIGLPNDCVEHSLGAGFVKVVQLPKGKIWVEGDNLLNSHDSKHWGPVPLGLVEGRVRLLIWPPNRFGLLEDNPKAIQNKVIPSP